MLVSRLEAPPRPRLQLPSKRERGRQGNIEKAAHTRILLETSDFRFLPIFHHPHSHQPGFVIDRVKCLALLLCTK